MKYDITKHTTPKMPTLGKRTKSPKKTSFRPQKTYIYPLFRCFFPLLAHTSASRKFSVLTTNGG